MNVGGTDAANALPRYLRNQAWKTLKEQGKA
jgi:tRNA threonylcarbamoyladenosine biosynthesis protein TsaB